MEGKDVYTRSERSVLRTAHIALSSDNGSSPWPRQVVTEAEDSHDVFEAFISFGLAPRTPARVRLDLKQIVGDEVARRGTSAPMTPDQARALARLLTDAADRAERADREPWPPPHEGEVVPPLVGAEEDF